MQGAGTFAIFFVFLIILSVVGGDGEPIFSTGSERATSTERAEGTEPVLVSEPAPTSVSGNGVETSQAATIIERPRETRRLSNQQIEQRLATLYRELDRLEDQLESALLREPRSPYAESVALYTGNARASDPEREYVMLRASYRNETPVDISDWYLQSVVTMESAAIPEGTRTPDSVFNHRRSVIRLEPGEVAYVLTDESPILTSFHENRCTGYLEEQADFFPSLRRSCPDPEDEMEDFASIALDNDACFDFVERVRRCDVPDEDEVEAADLSRECEQFLTRELNYRACVQNHSWEPLFDNIGSWRIYLDRNDDLWRREREIIRLIDGEDRVVDVVEY